MESGTGQPEPPVVEDHWLLDHHIEEILDNFNHAARMRDSGPDRGQGHGQARRQGREKKQ